ncbi:hypothetical protein [Geotalea toluenoxydans]|uniref:hypothetical protein n=1 Tax=Geotalea toluenoxydans TaxID=421624 RepID=UPI001FB250C2|nr:hypothetical protein [Geotalea toluenoxydans]
MQVAHLPVEHGQGGRGVLDKNSQPLLPFQQGLFRPSLLRHVINGQIDQPLSPQGLENRAGVGDHPLPLLIHAAQHEFHVLHLFPPDDAGHGPLIQRQYRPSARES